MNTLIPIFKTGGKVKIKLTKHKVKKTKVPATTFKKNGKTIHRKGYVRQPYVMESKEIVNEKISFLDLAKKVAKSYVGKKVPKKYQAKYGKVYSKADALEVGKKVAQTIRMREFKKAGVKLSK